jgi:hypothetical protein
MKRFFFLFIIIQQGFTQEIPLNVQKLMKAYPNQIIGYKDNRLYFKDNTTLEYDDFKKKSNKE